jgi:glucose/arabinose dehydrogenase
LFVVERGGAIRLIDPATGAALGDFMRVPGTSIPYDAYSEEGLLGLAFHPDYPLDPRFFVNYTASRAGVLRTVIASFQVQSGDPDRGDPNSETVLLEYTQPQSNHNGGMLAFGPDGCLYVGSGDGGNVNDEGEGHPPQGNGQDLTTHLGKILRVDVDDPQARPPGNLTETTNPHLWDYGLRNPWRFSFDRITGDLYIGDVGEHAWEEINVEPAGRGNRNYGWKIAEGARCRPGGEGCVLDGLTPPVDEYEHPFFSFTAVIGGYVYRGRAMPSLRGYYVYGADGESEHDLRAFTWDGCRQCGDGSQLLGIGVDEHITSLGEDAHGELYVLTLNGVYRVDPELTPATVCDVADACVPGANEERRCGTDVGLCTVGVRRRTCEGTCSWSAWSACGDGLVGPEPEICGNGEDENCNGVADDGCGCDAPLAPGGGGSFPMPTELTKLAADSTRCLVYGLNRFGDEIVVFDAAAKRETARVSLPGTAKDFDLSSDGKWLVAALPDTSEFAVVDTEEFVVEKLVAASLQPTAVEVSNAGIVYGASMYGGTRRVDLNGGEPETVNLGASFPEPEIELSADDQTMFLTDLSSRPRLCRSDLVQNTSPVCASVLDGGSFPRMVVSPNRQQVYYGGYQVTGQDYTFIAGRVGAVFAEDAAGQLAVGTYSVFDPATLRTLADLQSSADAAALINHDRDLWYYSSATRRMYYAGVSNPAPAKREFPAQSIESYDFSRLVRDPVRDRLYALDPLQELVVVIEASTLTPIVAIDVGTTPTDLALDVGTDSLYVGQDDTYAVTRIDLVSAQFDEFLPTTTEPSALETISHGRLVTSERSEGLRILDPATGAVLSSDLRADREIGTSADGNTLFSCQPGTPWGSVAIYDVSAGMLSLVRKLQGPIRVFLGTERWCVALPDGSGVFYAGELLRTSDLQTIYTVPSDVVLVTPDGRLATTQSSVLAVADGAVLGPLPTSSSVQAVSADSATLYLATESGIVTVDLGDYQ